LADTYTKIYIQVVFTVQGRHCLISRNNKEELFRYISGIISKRGQKLICINGMADHIHILIGLKPSISVSALIREVKTSSSKFINQKGWVRGKFSWQNGYGAFSYGQSQLNRVIRYIKNQELHHQRKSFRDEYYQLLKQFDIDYNEKNLFEWIE